MVKFTIVVNNTARVNATNVTVRDVLPDGFVFVSASQGNVTKGQTTTWTIPNLAKNSATELWIIARSNAVGPWNNTVNVMSDENKTIVSANASVNVTPVVLTVNKTANVTVVGNNTLVKFTIIVNNTGIVNATGISITDFLPGGLEYQYSGSDKAGQGSLAVIDEDLHITWENIMLVPNETVELWVVAKTKTVGKFVNNVSAFCKENLTAVKDNASVTVAQVNATLSKVANVTVVGNNTLVNFTITVNHTSVVNATNVWISDTLPDGFVFVNATAGFKQTGQVISWNVGTLTPGANGTYWIVARSNATGKWNNTVSIGCDENKTILEANATVDVVSVVLVVNKTANITEIGNNTLVKFTIAVNNTAKANATDIVVRDVLPDGFVFVSASQGNTTKGREITWIIPNLANGTSTELWIIARSISVGPWNNTVNATCNENNTNFTDSEVGDVVPVVLTVNKTANVTVIGNNTLVNFTIVVINTASVNATGVNISDELPDGFVFVDATSGFKLDGQRVYWDPITINSGANVTYWITARSNATGKWNNTVKVTSKENNTNFTGSEIVDVVSVVLTVNKTANVTVIGNNTVVKFNVTVVNTARVNATGVNISDELPDGFVFVDATSGFKLDGQRVYWDPITINSGANVTYWITARSNATGKWNNTVKVTSKENNTNFTDNATVNVIPVEFTVNKTANITLIGNNTVVKFTIIVNNTSNITAVDVVVRDVLPNGFVLIDAADNYNKTTNSWNFPNFAKGSVELWIIARSNATGTWNNIANVTSKENKTGSQDNQTVRVAEVNATIVKAANITLVGNNTLVNFTITVNHTSIVNATEVVIKDVLPNGFVFVNATAGYKQNGQEISWNVGTVTPGENLTYWIVARSNATGVWDNVVNITCKENSEILGANATVKVAQVNATIIKEVDVTPVGNNTIVNFTITVNHTSIVNATNVTVVDVLPDGFVFVNATEGYKLDGQKVSWFVGTVTPGENLVYWISARSIETGNWTNHVNVTCNENSTILGNTTDVEVVPVILTVNKTANITLVGNNTLVKFTIEVNNTARVNATNVTVVDVLPGGFEFVEVSAGNVTAGQKVTWTVSTLTSGQNVTFWIIARSVATGNWTNNVDVTCSENTTVVNDTADVKVVPINITVNKIATPKSIDVLGLVNFTIEVTNNAKVSATNVTITDILDLDVFEIKSHNGTFIKDGGKLVWTVDSLASGESYRIWIAVKALTNGTFTNTVNVTSKENRTVVTDSADVEVIPIVNLTVNKTVNVDKIGYNDYVVFTINVTNNGPSNATGVMLKDLIPQGLNIIESSEGNFDIDYGVLYIDLLEAGKSIEFTVTAQGIKVGNWTNIVEVYCNENATVKSSSADIEVVNVNLTIEKTANVSAAGNNSLVNFTIVVKNNDVMNATYLYILDTLPDGFVFVNATEGYNNGDNWVTWTVNNLSANSNITYWIVARSAEIGNLTNEVELIYSEYDGVVEANATVEIVPVELTICKTANVTGIVFVGDEVTFIVNVTNNARVNATIVNVTDAVPTGFEFVRTNASGYDNKTGLLTIPVIKAGESYVFAITLKALTNGTLTNVVNVTCNENATVVNTTADVNVTPVVNLIVEKVADSDDATIGDVITFTITVTNNGPSVATNIKVVDILDKGLTLISGDLETVIPSLASGNSTSIVIKAQTTAKGNYMNRVNVSCDQNDTVKSANASVHVYNTDIKINKTTVNSEVNVGDLINFTVVIKNHGRSNATNIHISDELDSAFEFVNASGNYKRDGQKLVWTLDKLANETTYSVWIVVKALTHGTFENVAHVNCSEEDTLKNSTASVVVNPVVKLVVEKTVDFNNVTVNSEVTFTINVTNNGLSNATGVKVVDVIPSGFEFVESSDSSYDDATGVLTIPVIKAGESYVFTITLKVIANGTLTNVVNVTSKENDTLVNSSVDVNVTPVVNLTVVKVADSDDATIGDVITFTITVTNNGPSVATNIKVVDILDKGLTLISGDLETVIPSLASGNSTSIVIKAQTTAKGNYMNRVNVSCDQNDTVKSANASVHVYNTDIKINKTTVNSEVNVGDLINFTVVIKNHGRSNATNIHISDELDSAFEFVNASGNYKRDGQNIVWTLDKLANETSYSVWIVVKALTNGTFENVAHVNCSEEDTLKNSTTSVNVAPVVNLTVEKIADVANITIGGEVTFTINVTNNGPSNATNVVVEDILPEGLQLVEGSSKVTIDLLESGKSYIVTIKVKTNATGNFTNVVSVYCDENATVVKDNVTVKVFNPQIAIATAANDEFVYSGNQTSFTVKVTNDGDIALTDIAIECDIPEGLIYDSFIGSNWTYDGEKFHYNGSLDVGESIELTIVMNSTKSGYFIFNATVGSNQTNKSSSHDGVWVYTPDLSIRVISNNPLVIVGQPVSFTIVVTNVGDCELGDIYTVDNFPDGLIYTGYDGGSWTKLSAGLLGAAAPGWTQNGDKFSYSGTLKPGESSEYTVYFDTTRTGIFTVESIADSNLTSNDYSSNDTVVIGPAINVTKVADKTIVNVSDIITFTITVINTGDCELGGIFVIENAPAELTFVGYSGDGWTRNGNEYTYEGSLAPGASASFKVQYNATKAGNYTNYVTAGSNMTGNVTVGLKFEVVNETSGGNDSDKNQSHISKEKQSVIMHETGNPIMLFLLVIFALIPIKRRKH